MLETIINFEQVKAISNCAYPNDTRYILNGVCLEFHKNKIIAVATNGKILAAGLIDCVGYENETEIKSVIIPLKWLKSVRRNKNVQLSTDGKECSLNFGSSKMSCTLLDGKYPNWRKVVPRGEDFKPFDKQGFDQKLMYLVTASSEAFQQSKDVGVRMYSTTQGTSAAPVPGPFVFKNKNENWMGLLMPRIFDALNEKNQIPQWVNEDFPIEGKTNA